MRLQYVLEINKQMLGRHMCLNQKDWKENLHFDLSWLVRLNPIHETWNDNCRDETIPSVPSNYRNVSVELEVLTIGPHSLVACHHQIKVVCVYINISLSFDAAAVVKTFVTTRYAGFQLVP